MFSLTMVFAAALAVFPAAGGEARPEPASVSLAALARAAGPASGASLQPSLAQSPPPARRGDRLWNGALSAPGRRHRRRARRVGDADCSESGVQRAVTFGVIRRGSRA